MLSKPFVLLTPIQRTLLTPDQSWEGKGEECGHLHIKFNNSVPPWRASIHIIFVFSMSLLAHLPSMFPLLLNHIQVSMLDLKAFSSFAYWFIQLFCIPSLRLIWFLSLYFQNISHPFISNISLQSSVDWLYHAHSSPNLLSCCPLSELSFPCPYKFPIHWDPTQLLLLCEPFYVIQPVIIPYFPERFYPLDAVREKDPSYIHKYKTS